MSNITDLNTTATRISRLLDKARPAKSPEEPHAKTSTQLNSLLVMALIGTMMPAQIAVAFFSFTFLVTAILYIILAWIGHVRISKRIIISTIVLTLISSLSGCTPALVSRMPQDMAQLIKDRDYKYYSIQKFGIFGLGTDDITVENAQFEGNIETVYVCKIERGYGIVSLSRVTVAGK